MNTTNESEIEEAYQWLIDQRDTMDPIYAGDDVIDNMISGNKALAVVYSEMHLTLSVKIRIWTTSHRNREPTDGMMQWLSQRTAAKYSLPMNLLIL